MRWTWIAMILLATAGGSAAQEQSNPEELNRKYQDALTQLKTAQDRKNELATENQALVARIAQLEKQLEEAREETKRQSAVFADQSFRLRSHEAAWKIFLRRYPVLFEKWKLFIASDPLALPASMPELYDPRSLIQGE